MPDPEGRLTTPVGINKDGLPRAWNALWGYSDTWVTFLAHTMTAAGDYNLDTVVVPNGYIYVCNHIISYDIDSVVNQLHFGIVDAHSFPITVETDVAASEYVISGRLSLVLKENDHMRITFLGCANGDRLRSGVWGYKMEL